MPHLDHVVRRAEGVGVDLRKGCVVALAMRVGADVDSDGSGREHAHLGRFHKRDTPGGGCRSGAWAETTYLDPARETNPEIAAVLAAFFLLLAQLLVAGHLESHVQRLPISARVVDQPEEARRSEIGVAILAADPPRTPLVLTR